MPPGCLSRPLGASWGSLGGPGGLLGVLGASRGPLGAAWGSLWWLLGASWGPLGAILGASWGLLGASWGHLGGDRSKKRGPSISPAPQEPRKSPPGPLLGRSWSALGRSWGRLGALLGPSWGPLGPSWSHLEASDGHRKRKGEKPKIICFLPHMFRGVLVFFPAAPHPRRSLTPHSSPHVLPLLTRAQHMHGKYMRHASTYSRAHAHTRTHKTHVHCIIHPIRRLGRHVAGPSRP